MRGLKSFIKKDILKKNLLGLCRTGPISVYSLMITTAIFPLYFKTVSSNAGVSAADSTAFLGYANSIATFAVSIMAPVLGALADYKGYRNPMFTWSNIIRCILGYWNDVC